MENVHPIYNIKALMIKRELAKDPKLRDEDWARFLPKFKNKNISKRKQPKVKKVKKEYTPFPPPMPLSKIDMQMQSGEFFLKESEKKAKQQKERRQKQAEAAKAQTERRSKDFIAPDESKPSTSKTANSSGSVNVKALKAKIKKATKTL